MIFNLITNLLNNMGTNIEIYSLLIVSLGSILFMVKDMRLGLLFLFFMNAIGFMIFNMIGRETIYFLFATMISFVMLTLSLLITQQRGGDLV